MRLANGIVLDKEKTFGVLKFSALRHEVRVENEDGTTSEEIKRRTYDLKCSQQERTIQVSIPAEIPVKDYPYNAHDKRMNEFPNQTLKICPNYISIIFFKCLSGFVPIA